MMDFLNRNPIIIGLVLVVSALFDLWILVFRFSGYQKFVQRHLWFRVLSKNTEPVSREARITGSIFFLVAGLMVIANALGWFSLTFKASVIAAPFIIWIALIIRDKWRNRKRSNVKTSSKSRIPH